MRDLGRCLVERAGLAPAYLTTLLDPADPQEVGAAVVEAARQADGVLVVYYVGHGLVSARNELYLSTQATLNLNEGIPAHQALPYSMLREALSDCSAPLTLVVLDCCFAGRAQEVVRARREAEQAFNATPSGMYLLASTDSDQYAWAPPGQGHTAFTGALIDLLTAGDPVAPSLLTLDDIYRSLSRTLTDQGLPAPRRHAVDHTDRQPLAPNPAYTPGSAHEPGEFSPYRGLAAFGPQDASVFFGREDLTTSLIDRVTEHLSLPGLLVLIGPSGAGKSSLLHAGLIPALRGSSRNTGMARVIAFNPGDDPVGVLARRFAALDGSESMQLRQQLQTNPAHLRAVLTSGTVGRDEPFILIVDQFEEVFSACPYEEQRRVFIQALHSACADPVSEAPAIVVIGLRADFFSHCAPHPELVDALGRPVVVGPMTAGQLQAAIEEPAVAAGLVLQNGLVDLLLEDLGASAQRSATRAGAVLPLLSHALLATWRHREGRTMTLAGYRATGGIAQSLARTADATLDQLTLASRQVARRLLPRLVRLGEDASDTARRLPLADLLPAPSSPDHAAIRYFLDQFARARLLTIDADSVQVTHEALIRAWPRLRTWIDADRSDLLIHQQLGHDARNWLEHDRDSAYLYQGTRLTAAQDARSRWEADHIRHLLLDGARTQFLETSAAADTHARRRSRRTRTALALSLVLALLASLAGAGIAVSAANNAAAEADRQRKIAVSRQLTAQSESIMDTAPALSRLLGVAAFDTARTDEARRGMLDAYTNPVSPLLVGEADTFLSLAAGELDGTPIVASGGQDGTVRVWDLATGYQRGQPLKGHKGDVYSMAFGQLDRKPIAVSGGQDGTVRVWDLATGYQRGQPLKGHKGEVNSVAFGQLAGKPVVVSGADDGTVRIWDLATGQQRGQSLKSRTNNYFNLVDLIEPDPTRPVYSVAMSQLNGKPIAVSGGDDGTVRVWDLITGKQLGAALTGHAGGVANVVTGQLNGRSIAVSGGADSTVRVWDLISGREILKYFTGSINALSLADLDGRPMILAAKGDTTLSLDIIAGRQYGQPLKGHVDRVNSIHLTPLGGKFVVVSSSNDGTVRLWDSASRKEIGSLTPEVISPVYGAAIGLLDDKPIAVSANNNATAWLWHLAETDQPGIPLSFKKGIGTIFAITLGQLDGRSIAVFGGYDGIAVMDLLGEKELYPPFASGTTMIYSVALGYLDGKQIVVSGHDDGTVRIWDLGSGKQLGEPLKGHEEPVEAVAFGQLEGKPIALSGGDDGAVRIWDLESRKLLGEPLVLGAGHVNALALGKYSGRPVAAFGSDDGTVRIWDLNTRTPLGHSLEGRDGPVTAVAFGQIEGRPVLLSGEDNGTIRWWDLSVPSNLPVALCAQAHRSLTVEEWRQYLPQEPFRQLCNKP
ncbi:caspase family protein [Streptosporangium sp. NPDC006013]|uniref:caspase, EACC1-associated type n=1 Tax=Streptosporangium sp. NPDC006013 TaxID=3155596 RepID=UPI0033BCDBAB